MVIQIANKLEQAATNIPKMGEGIALGFMIGILPLVTIILVTLIVKRSVR